METRMLGRGMAGVGILLALIAIWTDFGPGSYWSFDGTLSGLLLILTILAAFAFAGALASDQREYDLAYGALGGIGFGIYLFYPALLAFDQWDQLDAGAWLGICSALTFLGASVATWATDRPAARPSPPGALIAVAGLVLVVVGLFPSFAEGAGSYWRVQGQGHSYGALMLILVVLVGLSIASAWSLASGTDSALLLGCVTLGAGIAVPAQYAFNQWGQLGTGAWLTGVGGILVAAGTLAMAQLRGEEAPTAAAAPPPAA